MAIISCYTYGTPTVGRHDTGVVISVDHGYLVANLEDAERLHMQLGEVLAQLRAANDEGPNAPASQVAA